MFLINYNPFVNVRAMQRFNFLKDFLLDIFLGAGEKAKECLESNKTNEKRQRRREFFRKEKFSLIFVFNSPQSGGSAIHY
jgi:hypothetical protein